MHRVERRSALWSPSGLPPPRTLIACSLTLGVSRTPGLIDSQDVGTEHRAHITWSDEQVRRGLPLISQTIDPSWFTDAPAGAEGWSLVCEFDRPPREQGTPTAARVRFWMPDAPHRQLGPGVTLRLFERETGQLATVAILD